MGQLVIGIGGKKEVGKDTSAKILVEKYGFRRFAFADPLKEIVAEAFDLSIYDLHDPVMKETKFFQPFVVDEGYADRLVEQLKIHHPITDKQSVKIKQSIIGQVFNNRRQILQYVGTDLVRTNVSDSFWVDVFHNQIKHIERIVITDMRFPNEREFVRNVLKGKLLLLRRDSKKESGKHASENSLGNDSEYDAVIENTGSIQELEQEMERFYKCSIEGRKYKQKGRLSGILKKLKRFFLHRN
ncbi:MAG: hypothetical protein H7831_14720 [Magnetococcus sp. WYHC-3]